MQQYKLWLSLLWFKRVVPQICKQTKLRTFSEE